MKNRKSRNKLIKQNRILIGISLTLFVLIVFLAVYHFTVQKTKTLEEEIISSEIYPGLNLKTTKQEAELYTLFISQPITEDKKINAKINEWVMKEREIFKNDVERSKKTLKKNGFSAHLNVQTTTEKLSNKIYNLELESYQITAGANGSTKTESIIVDLNKNKILEIHDILLVDKESVNDIKKNVLKEVANKSELNDFIFEELLLESLENYKDWKFILSQDSFVFSFDQYQIASGNVGVVKIEIPMNTMIHYLNPDFANKLDLEIPDKQTELESDGKYIALTFDDGPHAQVTPRVLRILKEYEAKATFYMLGNQVEYYPSLVKQIQEEGHELGNHTKSHKDLTHLGPVQIREEIESASKNIHLASLHYPLSLRPPYGAFNETIKEISKELNLPIIMWSVDSLDWQSRNTKAINQEVMKQVHPGAIVLLHDIHPTTADALPTLLQNLKDEGYEFITVSQLLEWGDLEGIGPHYKVKID